MNLLKYRLQKKMTQKQLGDMVGVSDVTIFHYEKGLRNPKPMMLKSLANILECTVDELIGDDDEIERTTV